jgi:hypothetical protein
LAGVLHGSARGSADFHLSGASSQMLRPHYPERKDMNAQALAEKLNKLGFTPVALSEPSKKEDGMIVFTKGVHVQVPLFGDEPNVVLESSKGEFEFYDAQRNIKDLVADLEAALKNEQAVISR